MGAKRLMLSLCGLILLTSCKGETAESESEPDNLVNDDQEVVVVNEESKESKEIEEESEESKVEKRKDYTGEVPTTDRRSNAERASNQNTYVEDERPVIEEDYISLKDTSLVSKLGDKYLLYTQDKHNRSIGGEGIVLYDTLGEESKSLSKDEETNKLYDYELLPTALIQNERGDTEANKVKVTHQMYNNLVELNQNIHRLVNEDKNQEVSIYVEALYYKEDKIPYGVIYQAKSNMGDINFFYQINNIQKGRTVDYESGELS